MKMKDNATNDDINNALDDYTYLIMIVLILSQSLLMRIVILIIKIVHAMANDNDSYDDKSINNN